VKYLYQVIYHQWPLVRKAEDKFLGEGGKTKTPLANWHPAVVNISSIESAQ
jgi:hypothetical protein